ncbi:MAG TPA: MmgE/PrpD family protein [Burkholderiaceae bacterium]
MAGLTETIARFVVDTSYADLPPGALDKSKKVIADTFAVILSGAASEVVEPLRRYLEVADAAGGVPVLGTAWRVNAETAALVNGTFGHALDFDDVLSMMPAHPSAIIVAALIADLARHPLDGKAFIEAYAIGVEVGAKIGLGITVGHYGRGFHGSGTLGIFSAVGALAKAYGLDVQATRHAFGIASSMASGIRRNFGTMTKPLHTGWAARSALTAVRLAASGLDAAPDALEAKSGFFAAYGTDKSDSQVAADGLGKPWVVLDPGIALKKFACCYASHRGMDGVLALRSELGFVADDVVRLECRMPPGGMLVLTYPRPETGLQAKFSLQYSLAAGLLDGRYRIGTFSDAAVRRPEVAALLDRVHAFEDESCRGDDPAFDTRSSGSRGFVEVHVQLRDGTRRHVRVDKAPGHPSRELGWADVQAKFNDCAGQARVDAGHADAAFAALRTLDDCADVGAIVNLLTH